MTDDKKEKPEADLDRPDAPTISVFSAVPGILISMPQLREPHFERSIVLMLAHNHEGALGIVINHETDHKAAEVLEQFDLDWPGDVSAPLVQGGPVDDDSVWIVHDDQIRFPDTLDACPGVRASRSEEALREICEIGCTQVILALGCAGWGPGQLETEIASGSWINAPVDADLVFNWPKEEMWTKALERLGINPMMLVSGTGIQ